MARTIEITLTNAEGEEVTHTFPARNAVCSDCEGEGSTLNEAIRQHAYSAEEFREEYPDEEDRAEYFAGGRGMYGVTCKTCGGEKVMPEVATDRLSPDQVKIFAEWQKQQEERAREEAQDRRTRWFEDGCPQD